MATEIFSPAEIIQALRDSKGIKLRAAQRLGCTRGTIDNYCKRYPEINEAYLDARESTVDMAEDRLFQKAVVEGDTTALIFILKTLGKSRGYIERQEMAVQGNIVVRLPDEMRDASGMGAVEPPPQQEPSGPIQQAVVVALPPGMQSNTDNNQESAP